MKKGPIMRLDHRSREYTSMRLVFPGVKVGKAPFMYHTGLILQVIERLAAWLEY